MAMTHYEGEMWEAQEHLLDHLQRLLDQRDVSPLRLIPLLEEMHWVSLIPQHAKWHAEESEETLSKEALRLLSGYIGDLLGLLREIDQEEGEE